VGRVWEPQTFDEWDELMKEEEARQYAYRCFGSGAGSKGCFFRDFRSAFWSCPLNGLCNQVANRELEIPEQIKTQLEQLQNVV